MKNISKYINESVFDNNIKSAIMINGVTIYEPDWKKCEEYYQKRRKKYFGNKSIINLGDLEYEYEIVYNEDDCLIAINIEKDNAWDKDIYVLSPETIYMNHEAGEIGDGRQYVFSLDNIDDANDFDICFNCFVDHKSKWAWLSGCYSNSGRKAVEDELGVTRGYIPETISKKAKDVIKKYMN